MESQRQAQIHVAPDPEAYLGLVPLHDGSAGGTDDILGEVNPDTEASLNSMNYVDLDDKGHMYVDISDNPNDGEGVNSDSTTWFKRMFKICNNGKADATVMIDVADLNFHPSSTDGIDATGEPIVDVYVGDDDDFGNYDPEASLLVDSEDPSWVDPQDSDAGVNIDVGECKVVHMRTSTKSINAKETFGDEAPEGFETGDRVPLVWGTATVTADAPGASQPGES